MFIFIVSGFVEGQECGDPVTFDVAVWGARSKNVGPRQFSLLDIASQYFGHDAVLYI